MQVDLNSQGSQARPDPGLVESHQTLRPALESSDEGQQAGAWARAGRRQTRLERMLMIHDPEVHPSLSSCFRYQ